MAKIIRILIVFGEICSLLASGFLWLMGAAFSLTDRFNGPHTTVMTAIVLVEVGLLCLFAQAYRLCK